MSNWEAILRMDANRNMLPVERERYERIKQNHQRMVEMGLLKQVSIMEAMKNAGPKSRPLKPNGGIRKKRGSKPTRASARLQGSKPEYAELVDHDERPYEALVDLLDDDTPIQEMNEEQRTELQERRCGSQGRGSIYDSSLGITCHFCRQKKLCGERDCPRCNDRNHDAECIGKTLCQRCQSATGRFCRACLLIRYGETLEEARERMDKGEWLCPHCYEEEHPEEGWLCNSSICMKRAGRAPTGIAIFEAQRRGYASVAHWLQAQYRRKYSSKEDGAGCSRDVCSAAGKDQQQQADKGSSKGSDQQAGSSKATAKGSRDQQQVAAAAAEPAGPRRSGRLGRQ